MNTNKPTIYGQPDYISRREFLTLGGFSIGATMLNPWKRNSYQEELPPGVRLGRVTEGAIRIRQRPDINSPEIGTLYQDTVVPWLREVVGNNQFRFNQRWVETPDGYIWSPLLQPVENHPNSPLDSLPSTSLGLGMWVEVTIPFVDMVLINAQPIAPSVKKSIETGSPYRLYYGQVIWVDQIEVDANGQSWYRVNEKYGYGDIFWAPSEAFRPLSVEEIAPISPGVEDKRVDVNLPRQTVSCFEGNNEVFFCRASTGTVGTETPPSLWHRIWRKMVSSHMSGGTTGGGWDLAGIGWTTLFVSDGIAFHSTFWHNNYGEPMSRGCVNLSHQDARFIFRWTNPAVNYDPGDITVSGDAGTLIRVIEE